MTKKITRRLLSAIVFCALLVSIAVCGIAFAASGGNAPAVSEAELQEYYFKGETFTPPEAQLTYKGEAKAGETTLIYPSGKAISSGTYLLDEAGKYVLRYSADFSGVPVDEERTFVAVQHLYEFTGGKSRGYFGAHENVPDRKGLVLELAKGEEVVFNRPIDLNGMTKADSLLKLFQIPSEIGVADATQLIFKLTDTEDPENYLTITAQAASNANAAWSWNNIYVRAGAPMQPQSGWEGTKLHSGDKWGCPTPFSLYGICSGTNTYQTQTFSLQFDYALKTLYTGISSVEVVRFDDPAVFSDFWTGFEKGTAYLSVSCGMYNKNSMTLVFTDIAGLDLVNADNAVVRDSVAPSLTVEAEEVPQAVVGQPYKVFPASAQDETDKSPSLTCRVFYAYGSGSMAEYDVQDGAFVPDRAGEYTVEYRAEDSFGNVSVRTVPVFAGERKEELVLTLTGAIQEGVAGEEYAVRGYSVSGAIGESSVSVQAALQGSDVCYDVEGGSFIPEYAGTYTVTYTLSDYISSVTQSYEMQVVKGNAVRVTQVPDVPQYLIAGCLYNFGTAEGVDYSSGSPEAVQVSILSSDAQAQIAGMTYIPATSGKTTLTFVADNGVSQAKAQVQAQTVSLGYGGAIDMTGYFTGEGVSFTAASDGITASAEKDASFTFIKETDANFNLSLNVEKSANAFEAFEILVSDSEDPAQALSVKIFKNKTGENAAVAFNGKAVGSVNGSWYGDGSDFVLTYDNKTCKLSVGELVIECRETVSGAPFAGFASGRVRYAFSLEGVTGESSLRLIRLNNQTLNNSTQDVARPQITVLGDLVRNYKPGDTVIVSPAIATDVLDPNVFFGVTVVGPDGKPVSTAEGRELSNVDPGNRYEFKAEQQGNYSITWVAKDSSGREEKVVSTMSVVDSTDPVLSYETAAVRSGTKGKAVALPKIVVKDDFTAEVIVYAYLTRPDGVMQPLYHTQASEEGGSTVYVYSAFVPDVSGTWKVTFYAADEAGNTAIVSYAVAVA